MKIRCSHCDRDWEFPDTFSTEFAVWEYEPGSSRILHFTKLLREHAGFDLLDSKKLAHLVSEHGNCINCQTQLMPQFRQRS